MEKKKKERSKWLKRTKGKMSRILPRPRKEHRGEKGEDREEGKGKDKKGKSENKTEKLIVLECYRNRK